LYDFGGTDKGEIAFQKGDVLEVTEKAHAQWWRGQVKGKPATSGLFPANYVVPFLVLMFAPSSFLVC